MKTAGVIFSLDLIKTLYTGFANVKNEKKEEMEHREKIKQDQHTAHWKPYVGIGMLVIGGAFLILHRKK